MKCDACGSLNSVMLTIHYNNGERTMGCDQCSTKSLPKHSDVYWPGHAHYNSNICDEQGNPILIQSREHKAQIMREQGISEAGDKRHGAPYVPGRIPGDYRAKKR